MRVYHAPEKGLCADDDEAANGESSKGQAGEAR